MTPSSLHRLHALSVHFGRPSASLGFEEGHMTLELPIPVLAGPDTEVMGPGGARLHSKGDYLLAETDSELIGACLVPADGRLEEPFENAYRQLLALTRDWQLHRVWHYVPQINEVRGGLERYRQFNIGRWAAFEAQFGKDLRSFLPAASAVGTDGDQGVIIFRAGKQVPTYFENPAQVPAYHYPAEYGPRPPGFARGVRIEGPDGARVYLSGTASIEGHASVGVNDWATQFRTTHHNIETMLERMGVAPALHEPPEGDIRRTYSKCYLRDPESLPLIQEWWREQWGEPRHCTFVQAEICRSELDLEIEASIQTRPAANSPC